MQQRAFVDRFLERLDKIDPSEIESFILRTVAQRDFYARIFETLVEGVVIVDGSFRITLANLAARRILRWPVRRRILGEPLLDLLEEGPLRRMAETFTRDARHAQNDEIVLRWRSQRVYNVHFLPIFEPTESDSVSGVAIILQDVTSARDKQARSAQAEKIASLLTLTAGVAHEIKNPLNSLSIHAQLLERAVSDFSEHARAPSANAVDRIGRSCEVIREEVERLRKCVDDFIDAARPRRPDFSLQSINRVVEAVVQMASLELEERNIRIETVLDSEVPLLPIDEKQFQQALRNLLRNAMEAIDSARRPPENRRIVLRTALGGEAVTLEVTDNGCGIPQSELSKVFEPYYTTKFNGSGLGLMAVSRIVREHGGFIAVNSTDGEGTTFTIDLPVLNPRIKLLESKKKAGSGEEK
jgi:signal transduction histidine kinase